MGKANFTVSTTARQWEGFRQSRWSLLLALCATIFCCLSFATLARADLPDFTALVKNNEAAVVNISTVGETPSNRNSSRPRDPRMEEFYRFFGPPNGRGAPGTPNNERPSPPRRSLGSGFIIEEDGYILTNHHVVDGAAEIIVRMSDRSEYSAELIGSDQRSDLALLKIDADSKLPVLKMGDFDDVEVGQWVLAIGSPFGFDYSVTAGIVSAKGRSLTSRQTGDYVPFIQTDVAINPGNSGGPLFNLDGEVIGINAQIYSNSGGFMGVSFAIPIDIAMGVVEQLKENGRVARGWLGVEILELTKDLAEAFGLERPRGALISRVMEGSPAQAGGIEDDDIIIRFNGEAISRAGELPHWVGRTPVGEESEVIVVRRGKEVKLKVVLGELPENPMNASRGNGARPAEQSVLGITVRDLAANRLEELGVDAGAEVIAVSGIAEDAGMRVGDVVLRMKGKVIANAEALKEVAVSAESGDVVPVLVLRAQGNSVRRSYLTLRLPEDD
jgi:serine protease Do